MSDISLNQPIQRSDFKIAIVCALRVEYDAVCLLVDKFWDDDLGRAEGDQNFYTTGYMSNHNVVIILLASMGKTGAATAVANMRTSFNAVQLLLLVGICGGVPSGPRGEILLGDVILGDEIRLYDYGKQYPDGFQRSENFGYSTSNFNRGVRGLLNFLETDHNTQLFEDRISHHLQHLQEVASGHKKAKYAYPGAVEDKLFASEYRHKHHQRAPCICRSCRTDSDRVCGEAIEASCLETECDTSHTIPRKRIAAKQKLGPKGLDTAQRPTVHFGRLASADTVLKSAKDRDRLSKQLQVIGFEMEAAGFYNELPYVVVKSVCDYADSHKAKAWQPFAAATAASACKSLLESYHQTDSIPKGKSEAHEGSRRERAHSAICVIPLLKNERFVGRQDVLKELKEMLFDKQSFSRAALVGLGGVGKTQVGLQLAYLMKEGGKECSVLWIPALTVATFEQACADIASCIPRSRGGEGDAKKIVKDYFGTKAAGRWLLVLDNADDYDLVFGHSSAPGGLLQHLPRSDTGCVLVTTRDRRVAVAFAETNVVTLSEMGMEEAVTFFRKSLIRKDVVGSDGAIRSLLKFLERIPLAIAQAAAYINVNQVAVREFLGLLRDVPHDQISVLSQHFQDSTRYQESQNAIALTWLASFDKITQTDPTAAKLLVFLSCVEPKGIPRSLLPEGESREQFLHAIGTLLGYGFLNLHQENLYDMHRLVHIAASVWAKEKSGDDMNLDLAIAHVASVFPNTLRNKNRERGRAYLPHSLKILQGNLSPGNQHAQTLARQVGVCLQQEGRTPEIVSMFESLVDCTQVLNDDDPVRLSYQHELAHAYHLDGQSKKAIPILENVVAIREEILDEEHPDTLESQHTLAKAYLLTGEAAKAIPMLEQVMTAREKAFGEEHRLTVEAQHALARAYTRDGQLKKAKSMLKSVVAIRERTRGKDNTGYLASQHRLASLYYREERFDKAIQILESVTAAWNKREQDKDHLDHLEVQYSLAKAYHANDQTAKAVPLLEHVVSMHKKVSREDGVRRRRPESLLAEILADQEDDACGSDCTF